MNKVDLGEFRSSLRRIERYLFRNLQIGNGCCEQNISLTECHILMEIQEGTPIGMSELIDRLRLDKSVATRTVDRMVKTGLLERSEDRGDRRRKTLTMTEKGKATAGEINGYMDGKFTALFASMAENDCCRVVESAGNLAGTFTSWDDRGK